ncbi:cytochrome P450 71A8 [Prunus yedoensis var. nudiflora]|uniref:Cytochrome P450 71A8 n=1 Tax=Prunus yedoensis var. nudiflora TaxID=2094558 RepID=A0A314XGE6_PRUYE|nr:cytochrome P450 71A8 [Prunus yedoensis var. nudiflora]
MLAAGTNTTSTVVEWDIFELLTHPKVMKKLQNEARGIAGNTTDTVTEDDLVSMHYLNAVIKETLRLHPPVPLLLPQISSRDVTINGCDIKAYTQVFVNAWWTGRDPKSFESPNRYEPERFLDSVVDREWFSIHSIWGWRTKVPRTPACHGRQRDCFGKFSAQV